MPPHRPALLQCVTLPSLLADPPLGLENTRAVSIWALLAVKVSVLCTLFFLRLSVFCMLLLFLCFCLPSLLVLSKADTRMLARGRLYAQFIELALRIQLFSQKVEFKVDILTFPLVSKFKVGITNFCLGLKSYFCFLSFRILPSETQL